MPLEDSVFRKLLFIMGAVQSSTLQKARLIRMCVCGGEGVLLHGIVTAQRTDRLWGCNTALLHLLFQSRGCNHGHRHSIPTVLLYLCYLLPSGLHSSLSELSFICLSIWDWLTDHLCDLGLRWGESGRQRFSMAVPSTTLCTGATSCYGGPWMVLHEFYPFVCKILNIPCRCTCRIMQYIKLYYTILYYTEGYAICSLKSEHVMWQY